MRSLLSFALLLSVAGTLCVSSAFAGEETVKLDVKDETVEITIGGDEFTVYHFGKDLPKPFFMPVKGPGETVMSRVEGDTEDHPHQKGIWISVDEVNGIRYWNEDGKIRNASLKPLVPEGDPAKFQAVNHWLDEDDRPVVIETTVYSIHANGVIAADITFTAGEQPVTFGDTKEGLFGIRLRDALREREGGKVVNADGLKGSNEAWGKTSDWVDYYGEVDGRTVGAAIFDHPDNFRPSRYHVRNYGLFSISPFGESAYTNGEEEAQPVELEPGQSVRLRYGLYIHAGDTEEANVAETYEKYVEASN